MFESNSKSHRHNGRRVRRGRGGGGGLHGQFRRRVWLALVQLELLPTHTDKNLLTLNNSSIPSTSVEVINIELVVTVMVILPRVRRTILPDRDDRTDHPARLLSRGARRYVCGSSRHRSSTTPSVTMMDVTFTSTTRLEVVVVHVGTHHIGRGSVTATVAVGRRRRRRRSRSTTGNLVRN
ncbi:hypothetical protein T439DRAFT_69288 [Meredithblackwellia eburnea MCA 4105]